MKIDNLNEGRIKVPEEAVNMVLNYISNSVLGCMVAILKRKVIIEHIFENTKFELDNSIINAYNNIRNGIPLTDTAIMPSTDYNDVGDEDSINFSVNIDYKQSRSKGSYNSESNVVTINIFPFVSELIELLNMLSTDYYSFDDLIKDNQEEYFISEVDDMGLYHLFEKVYDEFMVYVSPIIEHELAHLIQYKFLSKKSTKQIQRGGDDYIGYVTSEIEYSPHIITSIKNIKSVHDYLIKKNIDKKEISHILMLMFNCTTMYNETYDWSSTYIAEKVAEILDMDTYRDSDDHEEFIRMVEIFKFVKNFIFDHIVNGTQVFFRVLKEKDIKRWKRAVKYTYRELKNEGYL